MHSPSIGSTVIYAESQKRNGQALKIVQGMGTKYNGGGGAETNWSEHVYNDNYAPGHCTIRAQAGPGAAQEEASGLSPPSLL